MTLKLADFGLAMEVTEPIYTVCGTPTYVAPEILAETGENLFCTAWFSRTAQFFGCYATSLTQKLLFLYARPISSEAN